LTPGSIHIPFLFMAHSDDMAERHGRVLTELSEIGMALARGVKARADEASSLKEAEALALTFHRIARSVRLTLALESRLARERYEIVRHEEAQVRLRTLERRTQVRAAVSRDIRAETEGEVAEALIAELKARLETDALFEAFLDGPVEAAIARIRQDLGLAANDAGAGSNGLSPAPPAWRSG
jgi:hypothetical protein